MGERLRLRFSVAIAGAMLFASGAHAEPDNDTIKRAQLTIRKLQQEKSALAAEVATLNATLTELRASASKSEKQLGMLRKAQSNTAEKLEQTQGQQQDLQVKADVLEEALRAAQGDNNRLTAVQAEQKKSLESCAQKNDKLVEIGEALIQKYHAKGFWDVLLQREPITGLREVAIENDIQSQRDALAAQKFPPPGVVAAPTDAK